MFGYVGNLPVLFLFAKYVLSFDSGVGADAIVEHEVPENSHPGSVLRQRVVILCCDSLDL